MPGRGRQAFQSGSFPHTTHLTPTHPAPPHPHMLTVDVLVTITNIRSGSVVVVRRAGPGPRRSLEGSVALQASRACIRAEGGSPAVLHYNHQQAHHLALALLLPRPPPPQDTTLQYLVSDGDTAAADALAATLTQNPTGILPASTWGDVSVANVSPSTAIITVPREMLAAPERPAESNDKMGLIAGLVVGSE